MTAPRVTERLVVLLLLVVALAVGAAAPVSAQAADTAKKKQKVKEKKQQSVATRFFDSEEPLALTLTANLGRLRRDKADKAPWRPATLRYLQADGVTAATVPLAARTRGIWRLKNCQFPPLRLDFGGKATKGTPFEGLDKPRLVSFCQDTDDFEQYVLQELQLYRVHRLLTPASHRVRLVRMTYTDSATGTSHATRYAFVLEEPDDMAARFGGTMVEEKGARAEDFEPLNAALVGVFQYFIGNSDWSVSQLHNAEIVRDSSLGLLLVPYDFDFAGAVNARYATPDPSLAIRSVRERLYRGHCATAEDYATVFALFVEKKRAIYALYADPIGRLLQPAVVKETLAYFDEFYRMLESPALRRREIVDACVRR